MNSGPPSEDRNNLHIWIGRGMPVSIGGVGGRRGCESSILLQWQQLLLVDDVSDVMPGQR